VISGAVITAVSGNVKTGPIAVTGRGRASCPTTCTFYGGNGCYTEGRIDAFYTKNSRTWTTAEARAKLAGAKSDRLRDRVDGDVLTDDKVDREYLDTLTDAAVAEGFRWIWGYTHSLDVTPDDVPEAYVMNASCETEDDVARAIYLGFPAVLTSHMHLHGDRIEGRPVVQCPATRADAISCGNCGGQAGPLCARKDRTAVILFPPHGAGSRKVAAAIEARYGLT
jgi:hypothetical protein